MSDYPDVVAVNRVAGFVVFADGTTVRPDTLIGGSGEFVDDMEDAQVVVCHAFGRWWSIDLRDFERVPTQ